MIRTTKAAPKPLSRQVLDLIVVCERESKRSGWSDKSRADFEKVTDHLLAALVCVKRAELRGTEVTL